MRNIKLIEVPSEIGAGTRGASLGVEAIKVAAMDFMSNFFIHFPSERIPNENKLLYEPIESPYAKRVKGVYSMYEKVSKAVSETLKNNFFPVVISGDHSIAGATIAGIKMAKPKSKLGVIWIDAHADLHTPYTTPSGNLHGMPLAITLGEDNKDCAVHKLDDETKSYWEKLKNIGKISPKVLPEDVVLISARDYEKEERAWLAEQFAEYNPEFYFITTFDFEETIEQFVQDRNIDIVINVPRNHSFYDSVFKHSSTKRLAFHSSIPVLAAHE